MEGTGERERENQRTANTAQSGVRKGQMKRGTRPRSIYTRVPRAAKSTGTGSAFFSFWSGSAGNRRTPLFSPARRLGQNRRRRQPDHVDQRQPEAEAAAEGPAQAGPRVTRGGHRRGSGCPRGGRRRGAEGREAAAPAR